MAIMAPEDLAQAVGKPPEMGVKPAVPAPPEQPKGHYADASIFRVGHETGENKSSEVFIRDETKVKFETWVKTYLESIIKLKIDPAGYDAVVNNPSHGLDKKLFYQLVDEERTAGGSIDAKINTDRFDKFFADDNNLGIVDLIMQEQMLLKMGALGVIAGRLPEKERQALMLSLTVPLTGREDPVSWRKRLPFFRGNNEDKVRFAQSERLMKALLKPDYGDAVQSLKNQQEREYIKAITGINVDALQTRSLPAVGVHVPIGEVSILSRSAKNLQNELLETFSARRELAKDIGAGQLDILPEQAILWNQYDRQSEQSGIQWAMEVELRFEEIHTGRPLGSTDLDIRDRVQARRDVAMLRLEHYIGKDQREGVKEKKREAIAKRKEQVIDPEMLTKRAKEHTDRKEAREKDAEVLTVERESVETYTKNIAKAQQDRVREQAGRQENLRNIIASLDNPAGGKYVDGPTALAALRLVQTDPTATIIINGENIGSTLKRSEDARAARDLVFTPRAKAPGESDRQYEASIREAEQSFKANKADDYKQKTEEITRDRELITKMMNELQAALSPVPAALDENLHETSEGVLAATKNLGRLQKEFALVMGWNGIGGVLLTEVDLLTESVDELLKRINTANTSDQTKGWSEAQNTLPEVRIRLIHAMTEAMAREMTTAIAAPTTKINDLIGSWEITENQLYTLTAEQIRELLRSRRSANPTRYVAAGTISTAREIEAARSEAGDRLLARSQAIEDMEQRLSIEAKTAGIAATAVNLNQEKFMGELAGLCMDNQDAILGRVPRIVSDITAFTDITTPTVADVEYSKAERDAALPKGYYEWINLLTDYRLSDKRGDYFKTMQTLLSPGELAYILNEELSLAVAAVPPAATASFNDVFTEIRSRVSTGTMDEYELRKPFYAIIDWLANQALAIT